MGHGEWMQREAQLDTSEHGSSLQVAPQWVQKWLNTNDPDIALHNEVITRGYPNRWGARIEVKSNWNLQLFKELLGDYADAEVVEWLKYGWPTGRLPTLGNPSWTSKNHKGATDHLEQLKKYIHKEAKYGAVMGPYEKIPFDNKVGISPLSTRPKKDSIERRVILDLSFPIGEAVNDGIPKDTYMGFEANLSFPKTDQFAYRIYMLGQGCLMFKVDLSRYFR